MTIGIGLALFTLITIFALLGFHKWTNKITGNYFFLVALSCVFLTYFIAIRWTKDISALIKLENHNLILNRTSLDQYWYSARWSKVLLLDMCPLMAALIPLSIIFDKTKTIAKVLAPIGLLGGMITIFFQISTDQVNIKWYEYVFIGQDTNTLYFLMHYYVIVLSILVLLNSKTFTKWSLLGTITFLLGFLIYVLTMKASLNITNNVTGLAINDWYSNDPNVFSEYGPLYKMLPLSFPGIVVFWYFWAIVFNFIVIIIKNKLTKNPDNDSKLSAWYIKSSFLHEKLSPFDAHIDNIIRVSTRKINLLSYSVFSKIKNKKQNIHSSKKN